MDSSIKIEYQAFAERWLQDKDVIFIETAVWLENTQISHFCCVLIYSCCNSQDKDVIFMETAVRLENARTHACIEAVPLPAKAFAKAPLYFKKVRRGRNGCRN